MGKIRWMQESRFEIVHPPFIIIYLFLIYEITRVIRLNYPTWLPGLTLPRSEVTFKVPSKLTAERIIP